MSNIKADLADICGELVPAEILFFKDGNQRLRVETCLLANIVKKSGTGDTIGDLLLKKLE